MQSARVVIVVVNWNTRDRLRECLHSVGAHTAPGDTAVLVVDNDSRDDSCAMVEREFPEVVLLRNRRNVGFARAVNRAAAASDGDYLLLLNSDARLTGGAFEALVGFADDTPEAAVVGAALIDPAGKRHGAATRFPNVWRHLLTLSGIGRRIWGPWYPSIDPHRVRFPERTDWVGGAGMLIRRAAFREVGGMDEGYFLYAEEMDLCYRLAQRGWQIWHQPLATVVHEGGGSGSPGEFCNGEILYASQMRFFDHHYGTATASVLKLETYAAIVAQQWVRAVLRFATRGGYTRRGLSLRRVAALRRGDVL